MCSLEAKLYGRRPSEHSQRRQVLPVTLQTLVDMQAQAFVRNTVPHVIHFLSVRLRWRQIGPTRPPDGPRGTIASLWSHSLFHSARLRHRRLLPRLAQVAPISVQVGVSAGILLLLVPLLPPRAISIIVLVNFEMSLFRAPPMCFCMPLMHVDVGCVSHPHYYGCRRHFR